MEDVRIKEICDAAELLFINKGYSNTKIRDISAITKISIGTIYSFFGEKKTISECVIARCISDNNLENMKYPLEQDTFKNNYDNVRKQFNDSLQILADISMKMNYTFENYICEIYESMYKFGGMYLIFETDEKEYKEYTKEYRKFRLEFFKYHYQIISKFIERGEVRAVPDIEYTCRMIIEIITWWAIDVRYKTFERNSNPSKDRTKAVCIDNLINAYSPRD